MRNDEQAWGEGSAAPPVTRGRPPGFLAVS
jgi:hypothetical protein